MVNPDVDGYFKTLNNQKKNAKKQQPAKNQKNTKTEI